MKKFGIIAACVVGVCIVVWFVAGVISGSRERREYDEAMAAAMDTSEELAFLGLDIEPSPATTAAPLFANSLDADIAKALERDITTLLTKSGYDIHSCYVGQISKDEGLSVRVKINRQYDDSIVEDSIFISNTIKPLIEKNGVVYKDVSVDMLFEDDLVFTLLTGDYLKGFCSDYISGDVTVLYFKDYIASPESTPAVSIEASPEPSVSQKPTPSADNPAPTPTPRATAAPTPEPAQSSSTGNAYQDILDEYTAKLKEAAPRLASEYRAEAANTSGGIDALAELSMEKIGELAEISVEGIGEMAEIQLRTGDYDEYEEWAGKLQDVYNDEAQKIMDAYMDSAM